MAWVYDRLSTDLEFWFAQTQYVLEDHDETSPTGYVPRLIIIYDRLRSSMMAKCRASGYNIMRIFGFIKWLFRWWYIFLRNNVID